MTQPARTLEFSLHGLPVQIHCGAIQLDGEIDRALGCFLGRHPSPAMPRTIGHIYPFDADQVLRHVSPTARPVSRGDLAVGLYEEGERFWIVDDRWGISEINLLRGVWRSWVLPHRAADAVHCMEMAVLWPLAQLLRPKGLHLLPAASVVKDDYATLLLSPFGIVPELEALIGRGYKIIGQRWTAARVEHDRVVLLQMPGRVERVLPPRRADRPAPDSLASRGGTANAAANDSTHDRRLLPSDGTAPAAIAGNFAAARNTVADFRGGRGPVVTRINRSGAGVGAGIAAGVAAASPLSDRLLSSWIDLTEGRCDAKASRALCGSAIVIDPGRRASAHITTTPAAEAAAELRRHWPIAEVHPNRQSHGRLAALIAKVCHCGHVQLSRRPVELAMILDAMRIRVARQAAPPPPKIMVNRAAVRAMMASRQGRSTAVRSLNLEPVGDFHSGRIPAADHAQLRAKAG
jgi:hypothetical protein